MFLMKCNRLQTVCEQSATAFTWRARVQQFVNRVQPFVITTANGDGAQATKNPVVEHKGSSDGVFDFLLSLIHSGALWLSDDPGSCLPLWLTPYWGG